MGPERNPDVKCPEFMVHVDDLVSGKLDRNEAAAQFLPGLAEGMREHMRTCRSCRDEYGFREDQLDAAPFVNGHQFENLFHTTVRPLYPEQVRVAC